MKSFFRSFWFALALTFLFIVLAIFLQSERRWLIGLAITSVVWSIVDLLNDWLGGDDDATYERR